ncbi:MAG TPA: hypothetical protein VJ841_03170 [Candidatus Saccharimonadales bacterium]|nr:hypothetical protein [Candidatus Saccharimonadales bacterium]
MTVIDALCGELSGLLVGREVAQSPLHPTGEIIRVCPPDVQQYQARVFFWEVEVQPTPDDGQGTWGMSFSELDRLDIIRRAAILTIFRRHLSDVVWE